MRLFILTTPTGRPVFQGEARQNVDEMVCRCRNLLDLRASLQYLRHKNDADEYGLGRVGGFEEEYRGEGPKAVWMYSGCRDDQTSADAAISGSHVGAMSWAFLECMKRFGTRQSYIQVLQNTRQILRGKYQQIPQLSVGYEQDLNYQMRF